MLKKILVAVAAVAAAALFAAPSASAADGQVFRTVQDCQRQLSADIAAGGGTWVVNGSCDHTGVVGPPVFGCTNPIENGGCIGDFWVEHTYYV